MVRERPPPTLDQGHRRRHGGLAAGRHCELHHLRERAVALGVCRTCSPSASIRHIAEQASECGLRSAPPPAPCPGYFHDERAPAQPAHPCVLQEAEGAGDGGEKGAGGGGAQAAEDLLGVRQKGARVRRRLWGEVAVRGMGKPSTCGRC
jgi:hypothetical protein